MISDKEDNEPDIFLKSKIYWEHFINRNQSIITDLFYGQYMSTLQCPVCYTSSINFDPFLSLTLPIPKLNQEPEFICECYFIFFDLKIYPLKILINLNRTIQVYQIRYFLAKILNINPLSFYMYYIANGTVAKLLNCSDFIDNQNAFRKIFITQIDPKIFNDNTNKNFHYLPSLVNKLKGANQIKIKSKIKYFTDNLQFDEHIAEKSEYQETNSKLNFIIENIKNQPNKPNMVLKEILQENENTVEDLSNYCPTNKTIGLYSNLINYEFEKCIENLFEILIEKIFKEEYELFPILKDKLKELAIKNETNHCSNDKTDKSVIDQANTSNRADELINEKFLVEKKYLKDLVNEITDINHKINILNIFNFILDKEDEFEKISYNSDENNFLNDNFIKINLDFAIYSEEKNNSFNMRSFSSYNSIEYSSKNKNYISPAVVLTINKNWTLKYLNEYIYEFLKNLIEKDSNNSNLAEKFLLFDFNSFNSVQGKKESFAANKIPFIIIIKPVFVKKKIKYKMNNINFSNQEKLLENQEKKNSEKILPNVSNFNNTEQEYSDNNKQTINNNTNLQEENLVFNSNEKEENLFEEKEIQICIFCENEQCDGCILPDDASIQIKDLLNKYKNQSINIDLKNEFLFIEDISKKTLENKSRFNFDFNLELVIQTEYQNCITSIRLVNTNHLKFSGLISEEHNLVSCFENFQRVEKLEKTNEWKCPKCKDYRQANKKLEIYRAPRILIIHFNRFSHFDNHKINTEIDFPLENLILDNYVVAKKVNSNSSVKNEYDKEKDEIKHEHVYDLFAIANHYGNLSGGHYIAVAKNSENLEWYQFNDSNVVKLKEINKSSAYLLFYRKRDVNFEDIKEYV